MKTPGWFKAWFAFVFIAWLAIVGLIVYIGHHFLAKYW